MRASFSKFLDVRPSSSGGSPEITKVLDQRYIGRNQEDDWRTIQYSDKASILFVLRSGTSIGLTLTFRLYDGGSLFAAIPITKTTTEGPFLVRVELVQSSYAYVQTQLETSSSVAIRYRADSQGFTGLIRATMQGPGNGQGGFVDKMTWY